MQPGVAAHATGTLLGRALRLLEAGPADSEVIAREVLGLATPPPPALVADRLAAALLGADPRVRRDHLGRWGLAAAVRAVSRLDETVFAVVDVETTGSRPVAGDRITEVAVIRVGPAGRVETAIETLVNPERPIPAFVTRLTRITNAMVREQPVFAEVVDDVVGALAGRVFVAHNVQFDWRFLEHEVRRTRDVRLDGPRVCTVKLARRLLPGLKNRGLDSVSRYFGIEIEARHRAGGDARATAQVLVRLLDRARDLGAETLDDLGLVDARHKAPRTAGPQWMDAIDPI
ncbi:MAG: 3'-5' exonuclease [Gemmatimonadota bacterium]|nr:3'-5' exonuclease [Gemmatimonadota bacterium]